MNPPIYLPGTNTTPGGVIRVRDLTPAHVRVEDVADTLAKICRFGGRVEYPYTVAQHAVLCSYLAEPASAFEALHHDDVEAFTGYGDALGPGKTDEQRALEQWIRANVVAPAFGLELFESGEVKRADMAALALEQLLVQRRQDLDAFTQPTGADVARWGALIRPMHWRAARAAYLERHWELYGVPA